MRLRIAYASAESLTLGRDSIDSLDYSVFNRNPGAAGGYYYKPCFGGIAPAHEEPTPCKTKLILDRKGTAPQGTADSHTR